LAITVICPEGIVQAADSRVTLIHPVSETLITNNTFDNAKKLLVFKEPHTHVSVTTYGSGTINGRTIHGYNTEFASTLPDKRIPVKEFAERFQKFFKQRWDKAEHDDTDNISFQVAGIDEDKNYGELYSITLPTNKPPVLTLKEGDFNFMWGGDIFIVSRIVSGVDPTLPALIENENFPVDVKEKIDSIIENVSPSNFPIHSYALQDAVTLARFLIATSINAQELSIGLRTIGGNIDICTITQENGCGYISNKEVK